MKLRPLNLVPLSICAATIALACAAQGLLGHFPALQLLQRLEWITYDWRLRIANHFPQPASDKLAFVYIGDDALTCFSQGLLGTNLQFGLKWPRHVYGRAVRELKAQGAKAVGLDLFFADRRPDHDRQTPDGLLRSDAFFAQQLKQAGNVVIGATREVVPHPLFRSAAALGDLSHERDSDGVLRRDRPFQDYRIWHPEIEREALLSGWELSKARFESNQIIFPQFQGGETVLGLNPDGCFDPTELHRSRAAGGVVRLYRPFEEARVWHLGIVLAARELDLDLATADVDLEKGRIVLSSPAGLQRIIPVDRRGQFLIDWSLPLPDERLTKEAFESLVSKDILRQLGSNVTARFADKLVTIGSTATGNDLTDRGATPLEKDTFLTSNYWNVANSVLTGRFVRSSSLRLALGLIALMGLGAALLTWRLPTLWASLLVGLLVALFVLLAAFVFVRSRLWLPLVIPGGVALLTHFGLLAYQAFFEQNERRRIKSIFTRVVSPDVVNELLKAPNLSLVGARRQVTVFFADVRGFTEMTDQSHARAEAYVRAHGLDAAEAKAYFDRQAQELLNTVNLYLSTVAELVKKHEGTLDKYIGDCVMAFWGAPAPNQHHALACVRAAIEAQRAIYELNRQRAARTQAQEAWEQPAQPAPASQPLTLGTGINTGVVTVGLMGSEAHVQNYTVFGREVNLASRLEGYSGRERIVISESTHLELLRDDPALAATCIALPPTRSLKGFGTAVKVFEVPWKTAVVADQEPEPAILARPIAATF